MYVPRRPSDAERRDHEIHHKSYRSGANIVSEEEEKKVFLHLSRGEQSDDGIPVMQMDHAFLHDTGDKDAKVTLLTMVDSS